MSDLEVQSEARHDHAIKIHVNVNREPVVLQEKLPTGSEIKREAIEQGVDIKPTFQLILRRPGHPAKVIGDNERVPVHDGDRFRAIPPDDNS